MQVDSVTLKDGSLLLAYNNNQTGRTPLSLARSGDGGTTWQDLITLEADPQGAFAYPTLLYDDDKVCTLRASLPLFSGIAALLKGYN